MRRFGTEGPVNPQEHYVVTRSEEIADLVRRIAAGKYITLFAPRQTGKTTLFQAAVAALPLVDYFPIQLNFDDTRNSEIRYLGGSGFREYVVLCTIVLDNR